jgi:DNA invertase Pin-like site-specific DNA recombinase
MTSRVFGYTRTLRAAAPINEDVAALMAYGVEEVFVDAGEGHPRDRPELKECLARLGAGDTLVVTSAARLSHSLNHLVSTLRSLDDSSIFFRSLAEPALDLTHAPNRATDNYLTALDDIRRTLLGDRVRAGLGAASADGRRAGRPSVMTPDKISIAVELRTHGRSIAHIANVVGVSPSALRRALQAI